MTTFSFNPVDTIWWRTDRAENLMVIECLVLLEGHLDRDRFAQVLSGRVVDRYPVFRSRPARPRLPGGLPRWVEVTGFRVEDHLHEVRLPAGSDDAAVQRHVGRHLGVALDPGRSPWEMHLIEGHPRGTVLYVRLHHALADGIALTRVLLSLTDERPDAAPDEEPAAPPLAVRATSTRRSAAARAASVAASATRTPGVLGKLLLARKPPTRLSGRVAPGKAVRWCEPVPLAQVKELARSADTTVNDVLAAALAGALHRYQAHHDGVPVDLPTMIPVNLRPLDRPLPRRLGNRFALVILRLPSGDLGPGTRLAETKRRMDRIKGSPEPVLTFALLHVIGLLGAPLGQLLVRFFAAKAIGVTTNVPGPPEPRYLAGTRIEALLGWVPGSGEQALGVCIFTYAGAVHVGLKTDVAVIPDPDRLLACFGAELREMLGPVTTAPAARSGAPLLPA